MISSIRQEDFETIFKQHVKIETYSKSIDSLFSPRCLVKSTINHIISETMFGTTIKQLILLKVYIRY
jgi:hypothetical protein